MSEVGRHGACSAPNRSCWDGAGTKALLPRQDSHPVTPVKGEGMGAIMKCRKHLISLDKDGHSVTKGCKAGSSVLWAIYPVTLTSQVCCSRACSTQQQDSRKEPGDEAAPAPHRLLLVRHSEIPHSCCLQKALVQRTRHILQSSSFFFKQINLVKERTISIYASLNTLKVSSRT